MQLLHVASMTMICAAEKSMFDKIFDAIIKYIGYLGWGFLALVVGVFIYAFFTREK